MLSDENKNNVNELIQENKLLLISIFSKLSSSELKKQAEVSEAFKSLVAPIIQEKNKTNIDVLPKDLTKYCRWQISSIGRPSPIISGESFFQKYAD